MPGQDSEQATGTASARSTCARDVPQNRVDWPLLIVLGIAWSGEADVLLGLHLRESGSFGLSVCFRFWLPMFFFFKLERKKEQTSLMKIYGMISQLLHIKGLTREFC